MESREKIVDSALALFARDGFSHVTLRDVANHADCWLGSVSFFFPKKELLWNAAVLEASRRSKADILFAIEKEPTADATLRRFCRMIFESFIGGAPHFVLMDRTSNEIPGEDFPMNIRKQFDEIHTVLSELILSVTPTSAETPIRWTVSYLIGLLYGTGKLHRQHLAFLGLNEPEAVEQFLDKLIDFAMKSLPVGN